MESVTMQGLMIVGLIFLFLASGMWIAIGMAGVGIIILYFMVGGGMAGMIKMIQFNIINDFILGAIPLFIFMGSVLFKSRIANKIYSGLQPLVWFLPGGLLQTNIMACAVFAACSGSSLAGAATMGTVAIPELRSRGYDRKLTYGSLAAGGSLASMIPPSICFIVYGAWVGESVGQLFIAGVFPGLIMAGAFMLYIALTALIRPRVAPPVERLSAGEMLRAVKLLALPVLLIVSIMGSIYSGIATPTESAAVGSVVALLIAALDRNLSWRMIRESGEMAVRTSCMVLFLIITAQIISMGVSMLKLPTLLTEWILSQNLDKLVIIFAVCALYIFMGCIIEGTCVLLLTLPVVYPLVTALGYDPLWLGVMMAVFIEMGVVTPPIGLNLFIIHGMSGEESMTPTIRGAIPFFICMFLVMLLLIFVPDIALYLPRKMFVF